MVKATVPAFLQREVKCEGGVKVFSLAVVLETKESAVEQHKRRVKRFMAGERKLLLWTNGVGVEMN